MSHTPGLIRPLVCLFFSLSLAFSAPAANAQGDPVDFQSAVSCQRLDGKSVASEEFRVDNFDMQTEAFLLCKKLDEGDGPQVMISGKIPQKKNGNAVSLTDFLSASQVNPKNDVFVESQFGVHPVESFNANAIPVDGDDVDEILGDLESRTVTQEICRTEYETQEQCSREPKETCTIVYGRKVCTTTYEEVCNDIQVPVEVCEEETIVGFYRHLKELQAYTIARPDGFCPYGIVEKQTKTVYGRTINERRCCESKVIDGVLRNVCTDWQTF